jgi:hypothetical protein
VALETQLLATAAYCLLAALWVGSPLLHLDAPGDHLSAPSALIVW